jgi:hypothetical protein
MRSVRLLLRFEITADGMRGSGWRRSEVIEASPAMMCGLTSMEAGGVGHSAGWMSSPTRRAARGVLKVDAI